ncbi:LacI family DNA-binding transcriptional regulator [Microbacterium sp. CJ88]|uniref:LacI family DNA-binding transcriptional regulator n=1 Tax=Microbacterium sp. CJ88 TaxID=3445672 RepID=UPI003F655E87
MADVAVAAGVSGQTVSRVVNASPRVDPDTRARVEQAMATLGYRPHRAARALRTGRTGTIGLLVSTLATVGNSRMLQAVADAAASRGYALTVVTLTGPDAISDAFDRLRDQGVDGAIVLNEATAFARAAHAPSGLRLVVVDTPAEGRAPGVGVVQTDHAAGARAATEHLLGLGHRAVDHLAGPADSFAAAERERGWREALAAAGATGALHRGDWTSRSGFELARGVEASVPALFAANDQMALGALRAFAEAGRRVPEDVAVAGFDDVEDAAQYSPPLTTVRQDFDDLGRRAVAALVEVIEHDAEPEAVTLTPALVVRASSVR